MDDIIDLCSSDDDSETDTRSTSVAASQVAAVCKDSPRVLYMQNSSSSIPSSPIANHSNSSTTITTTQKKYREWKEKQQPDVFQFQCWSCQVPLCNPNKRNLEVSCYAVHSHPLLKIPTCSVCSGEIAMVELAPPEEKEELCSVCCTNDEDKEQLFVICDSCSRQVCSDCVQQANPAHPDLLQEILEHTEKEWHCCCCRPTDLITSLQSRLEMLSQNHQSIDVDTLLDDLDTVEQKKLECEQALESPDSFTDIQQEIFHSDPRDTPDLDLDEQVKEEYELWKDQQEKHYQRLVDMVTTLQEELERQGFNLKQFYASPSCPNEETEPTWKLLADKQIDEQKREEEKKHRQHQKKNPPPHRKKLNSPSDEELLDDVEDLGSLSDTCSINSNDSLLEEQRAQWRTSQYRAQKWEIEEVMQAEDEMIASRSLKKPTKILESQDVQVTKDEDRTSARVRRDSSLLLQQRKQQRRSRKSQKGKIVSMTAVTQHKPKYQNTPGYASEGVNNRNYKNERRDEGINFSDEETIMSVVGPQELFQNSECVLSTDSNQNTITVAEPLARLLKPHQKEGIQFMFQNTFNDLAFPPDKVTEEIKENVSGCILAHNMGLGKSLSCIALLHTIFFHPSLLTNPSNLIHTVILVVPVNTIVNWINEFEKWTGNLGCRILVHNLADSVNRVRAIEKWSNKGGVLLMSNNLFQSIVKKNTFEKYVRSPGPDVIILDEAHLMLKNRSNEVFKALNGVKTRRRICLTGSPFQNNLFEYFRMASYIRPGVLGHSEQKFEKDYVNPIVCGMSIDSTDYGKATADQKVNAILEILQPYVQRKDASVLLEDLPPMQQVVLHVRPTKVQSRLYGAYKKHIRSSDDPDSNNFLRMYSNLRTVHNHPGCLLLKDSKGSKESCKNKIGRSNYGNNDTESSQLQKSESNESVSYKDNSSNVMTINEIKRETSGTIIKEEEPKENAKISKSFAQKRELEARKAPLDDDIIDLISDSEDETSDSPIDETLPKEWWYRAAQKSGIEKMSEIGSGNKVVLLLHILTHADKLDEKVVLFSQCLKTLDFLSDVLSQPAWASRVPSLQEAFPAHSLGSWKSGKHFLRLDGQTSAGDRGDLISQFNDNSVRLFLISSRAGGIGINLCSANRIILFDSNFNPTVDTQALYRCYRYGQKRDVFAYRFLTEGTIEEKVYSRAVNKSSLALSLVDGKKFHRVFTEEETADFSKTDEWVACERCNKWRMFPPDSIDVSTLPDKWYCEMMNEYDKSMVLGCAFPERDASWYSRHFSNTEKAEVAESSSVIAMSGGDVVNLADDKKEKLAKRDEILTKLLDLSTGQKKAQIVSRYHFHDALLTKEETEKVITSSNRKNSVESDCKKEVSEELSNGLQASDDRASDIKPGKTQQVHDVLLSKKEEKEKETTSSNARRGTGGLSKEQDFEDCNEMVSEKLSNGINAIESRASGIMSGESQQTDKEIRKNENQVVRSPPKKRAKLAAQKSAVKRRKHLVLKM